MQSLRIYALALATVLATITCRGDLQHWPSELTEDADLHAVTFVSDSEVWAVGDRGAIWRSEDGGRSWALRPSGTKRALHDVSFVTQDSAATFGTIVGGGAQPWGLPTEGVVLRTTDGGANWEPPKQQLLPALFRVVADGRSATAVGDAWPMFPAALFRTNDAGRTWNGGPGRVSATWVDGDFSFPERPLLVSDEGDVVAVSRTTMGLRRDDSFFIREARWLAEGVALAVGDEAAVIVSNDNGQNWHDMRRALPTGVADQFDFQTLHVDGPKIWIAGTPGTKVFHSDDAGRNWKATETGQALPINDIQFAKDGKRGIAVGALGLRLVTSDGGTTWQTAREPGRTSALIIAPTAEQIPLDLIAHLSLGHGYRCRVALLDTNEDQLAVNEAVRTVGGDPIIPIRGFRLQNRFVELATDEVEKQWRLDHAIQRGGTKPLRGSEALVDRLSRQIKTWRPDLVVAACDAKRDEDQLIRSSITRAVEVAGEASLLPQQSSVGALRPWNVSRVVQTAASANGGGQVNASDALVVVQSSISSRVAAARAFLQLGPGAPTKYVSLNERPIANLVADLNSADGRSRRTMDISGEGAALLARRAATHHNIQALLEKLVQRGRASSSAQQLAPLVKELDEDEQVQLLFWIARQFHSAADSDLALQTLDGILQRDRNDAIHHAATMMKLQLQGSPEYQLAARSLRRQTQGAQLAGTSAGLPAQQIAFSPAALQRAMRGLPPSAQSLEWLQFSEAASRREGAKPADKQRIYERLRKTLPNGQWRNCAMTEAWLADPNPDPRKPIPKTIREIGFAKRPPTLDGSLEEEFWTSAAKLVLEPQDARAILPTSIVRIARDERYLYIAAECGSSRVADNLATRQRDTDLSEFDRIEFSIDTNRDYSSGWKLTIDERGWANDAFELDSSWNPRWHIARATDAKVWTIEAAIPLTELVTNTKERPVWLIGVRRILPTQGIATWPPCSDSQPGWQHAGHLLVEQDIH